MWIRMNPNPEGRIVPDCVIRAISIATGKEWLEVSDELYYNFARRGYSVTCDDAIWGRYLYEHGFKPFLLPASCPRCTTVRDFCLYFPHGTYIIGTGGHAVAVINGNYYDTWDCGDEVPSFFWWKQE